MLKYIACFVLVLFAYDYALAQRLPNYEAPRKVVEKVETPTVKAVLSATPQKEQPIQVGADKKDVDALVNTPPPPPAEMTPEEKAAIDIKAKINLNTDIQTQTKGERQDTIEILTSSERLVKRRELIAAGKSDKEISEEIGLLKKPKINPAVDKEMREYLYKKAKLTDE